MSSKHFTLNELIIEINWDDFKMHIAQQSGQTRPSDVFARSFSEWQNDWNGSWHSKHCWNRKYIFSIIELPNRQDRWLFGGIFKVREHKSVIDENKKKWIDYRVDLVPTYQSLIGRLIIKWKKDARSKDRLPHTIIENMSVAEILPEKYRGEEFPGYLNVNHNYEILRQLWRDYEPSWKNALQNCKGVYLISDIESGLRYVGSAYGDEGIWSRWNAYFSSGGHADNELLKKFLLEANRGESYAQKNFKFAILEQVSSKENDNYTIARESYWKDVLVSRGKYGWNKN